MKIKHPKFYALEVEIVVEESAVDCFIVSGYYSKSRMPSRFEYVDLTDNDIDLLMNDEFVTAQIQSWAMENGSKYSD